VPTQKGARNPNNWWWGPRRLRRKDFSGTVHAGWFAYMGASASAAHLIDVCDLA